MSFLTSVGLLHRSPVRARRRRWTYPPSDMACCTVNVDSISNALGLAFGCSFSPTVKAKGAKCAPLAGVAKLVLAVRRGGSFASHNRNDLPSDNDEQVSNLPCSLRLLFGTASTPQTGPIRARIWQFPGAQGPQSLRPTMPAVCKRVNQQYIYVPKLHWRISYEKLVLRQATQPMAWAAAETHCTSTPCLASPHLPCLPYLSLTCAALSLPCLTYPGPKVGALSPAPYLHLPRLARVQQSAPG
jgi:hypothetical protein